MFKRVLIPIDLAHKEQVDLFIKAAQHVIDEKSEVTLLYVDTILEHGASGPLFWEENYREHFDLAQKQLDEIVGRFFDQGVRCTAKVRAGNAYDQILLEAKERQISAIIIAAHRPDFASYFIGSTAARVVRHADCSVLVLRV